MARNNLNVSRCLLLLGFIALASRQSIAWPTSKISVIDQDQNSDVQLIASKICGSSKGNEQISRMSTVSKLVEYFKTLPSEHELSNCKSQNIDALIELNELLSTSNDNVCSDEKVSLIEQYHNSYVSNSGEHKRERKDADKQMAPQMVRVFFMHYAMQVNAICKRNLVNNLEIEVPNEFKDVDEFKFENGGTEVKHAAKFKKVLNGAIERFTSLYSIKRFDDVVLIWNMIETDPTQKSDLLADNAKIVDEVDPQTGERIRLLVKVKLTEPVVELQRMCHYKFKPIYGKLILPIVRLSDLGYSKDTEEMSKELKEFRTSETVKHWYGIAQICEALLPMKVFQDSNLEPDQAILITRAEAAKLDDGTRLASSSQDQNETEIVFEPSTNSIQGVDQLEGVFSSEAQKLVARVNTNKSLRRQTKGRAIRYLLRQFRSQFKPKQSKDAALNESAGHNRQRRHILAKRDYYRSPSDRWEIRHMALIFNSSMILLFLAIAAAIICTILFVG